jgi:hypothetical protein
MNYDPNGEVTAVGVRLNTLFLIFIKQFVMNARGLRLCIPYTQSGISELGCSMRVEFIVCTGNFPCVACNTLPRKFLQRKQIPASRRNFDLETSGWQLMKELASFNCALRVPPLAYVSVHLNTLQMHAALLLATCVALKPHLEL